MRLTDTAFTNPTIRATAEDPEAYAIRIVTDSMKPRVREGDTLLLAPNRAPAPGDDVLVRLVDGTEQLRRFIACAPDQLDLGALNVSPGGVGSSRVCLPLDDIESMHCVVARSQDPARLAA